MVYLPFGSIITVSYADGSFQILHAKHSLEKLINEFIQRDAIFDIIFWEGLYPSVLFRRRFEFS
jgi:hypothetical protein